ncbi:MAG: adenosine deaminase, partial [Acidimicrobiia bacterium]|nr:adenosine deaminase [Acidimicrobiia bacterium]
IALILCFLRHLPVGAAMETLHEAEPHLDGVVAVGLDSSEKGNPPRRFVSVYDEARVLGLRTVAHAGEEGPPAYVRSALDDLGVERIDHGVRCLDDPDLVDRLVKEGVPLTVCPLSNVALQVVADLSTHPLPQMMERGLNVSIHSDDPAYFGGDIGVNYERVATELSLTSETMRTLAANSVRSSFLDPSEKTELLGEVETYG